MDQESTETHQEPPPVEEGDEERENDATDSAMVTATGEEQEEEEEEGDESAETVHSNYGSDEPEEEDTSDIVAEVRGLYGAEKIETLIRLVQSRTVEVRCQRQLEVYQVAMETAVAEKTQLQLDLAYYDKMLSVLEREANESKSMFATVSQQHTDAVKMIEQLDLKRTQFLKEEQMLKTELAEYKRRFLQMQQDMLDHTIRSEAASRRCSQLQVQLDKLAKANEMWQKKVCETEAKQQQMVSAHSAQLNELENMLTELDGKLKEAQCRIDGEKRSNAVLKEHTDSVLAEKTQLAMELTSMENRMAAMEAEFGRKMAEVEAKCRAKVEEESAKANGRITGLTRTAQELGAEKDLLLAKLAQQKDVTAEMEGKLGGMQAILEDRNNEIFSLHSKLNCELKRFEDLKQQFAEGSSESSKQLSDAMKASNEKESKIARLEEDLRNQANSLSTLKAQLEMKDAEIKQLKDKTPNVDHYVAKIKQLETALADQSSKVTLLEHQLDQHLRASTDDKSVIVPVDTGSENHTAQITSTPIHVETSDSGDDLSSSAPVAAKKPKSISASSPNYSSFQGSVQRKRTATSFFKRTAEQVSITNTSYSSQIIDNINLNVSAASTMNVDDDPMDIGNLSNISVSGSSVRYVKPFFRKFQDKK